MTKVRLIALLLIALVAACRAPQEMQQPNQPTGLTIRATYTGSYCGGMAPTDEMLENARQQRPYPNKVFIIEADDERKKQYTVTTDQEGIARVALPYGSYRIKSDIHFNEKLLEELKANKNYHVWNEACIQKWQQDGYSSFVYDEPKTSVQFNIHRECFLPEGMPCIGYAGPMPP